MEHLTSISHLHITRIATCKLYNLLLAICIITSIVTQMVQLTISKVIRLTICLEVHFRAWPKVHFWQKWDFGTKMILVTLCTLWLQSHAQAVATSLAISNEICFQNIFIQHHFHCYISLPAFYGTLYCILVDIFHTFCDHQALCIFFKTQ